MEAPRPNDRLFGGIVVASTFYGDAEDMPDRLQRYTIILLMPEPPFYRVGIIRPRPKTVSSLGEMIFDGYAWEGQVSTHRNIVPTVNGDPYPNPDPDSPGHMTGPACLGYVDLGGDW